MRQQEAGKVRIIITAARLVNEICPGDHVVELLDRRIVFVAETKLGAIGFEERCMVVVTHAGNVMNHLSHGDFMAIVHQVRQIPVNVDGTAG